MVFASIWEHASRAFIFASTSSDQFSHASSEYFVNCPPVGISLSLFKSSFGPSNVADTFKTGQAQSLGNMIRFYRGSTIPSSLQQTMTCLICLLLQNYFI